MEKSMKNVIKPLIAAGLLLTGLSIESAAALRQASKQLAAHAGATLRIAAGQIAVTPALRRPLLSTQTTRAIATLSQFGASGIWAWRRQRHSQK